jgi:hypothetical protein
VVVDMNETIKTTLRSERRRLLKKVEKNLGKFKKVDKS